MEYTDFSSNNAIVRQRRQTAAMAGMAAVVILVQVGSLSAQTTTMPAESEKPGPLSLWRVPLTGPIITDRPDFTESPITVPRGHLQLETGYTGAYDREDGRRESAHSFPEALLRIGLMTDFELRLGWTGFVYQEELFREKNDAGRTVSRNPHERNAADLYVGFKLHLLDQGGGLPDLAIIPALTLPTGQSLATSGDVDPEIKLAWSYDLSEQLALSGNLNLRVPTEDAHRFVQTAASVSLNASITEWLGCYGEYFGFYPNAIDSDCAHYLNGGFTLLATENLQFDIRAGAGLNEEAVDAFFGAGVSIRW